jgi:hypothetical protein
MLRAILTTSLLWALPLAAQEPAGEAPSAPAGGTSADVSAAAAPVAPPPWGQIGVGMAASGAVLAVGGAVAATLLEAQTRPARAGDEPDELGAWLTERSGVVGVLVAAVSTVLIVGGAALVLSDELPEAPPAGATASR